VKKIKMMALLVLLLLFMQHKRISKKKRKKIKYNIYIIIELIYSKSSIDCLMAHFSSLFGRLAAPMK